MPIKGCKVLDKAIQIEPNNAASYVLRSGVFAKIREKPIWFFSNTGARLLCPSSLYSKLSRLQFPHQ